MKVPARERSAGFWRRFLAHLGDSILLTLVSSTIELILLGTLYGMRILFMGPVEGGFWHAYTPVTFQVLNLGLYLVVSGAYFGVGHAQFGTTLCKKFLDIYVVDYRTGRPLTLGRSMVRFLGYGLSYLPMCAGFLMAGFGPERLALHDLVGGSRSVVRPRAGQGGV